MIGLGLLFALSALGSPVKVRALEKSTRTPIPAVELSCTGELVAETDSRGWAVIEVNSPVTCVATSATHQDATIALSLTKANRVWLIPSPADLAVVIQGRSQGAHPSLHRIDAEIAMETPGALDDSMRLIQSLPTVTVQREYGPNAGDLSIRGSGPDDNRYFLDGVEVPFLYHFNQYASVFPTTEMSQIALHPSSYSTRYGDSVGAIIEASSNRAPPKGVHGTIGTNALMAGASLQVPLQKQKENGWWISGAARRSYLDLASSNSDQYSLWPVFYDYTVRAQNDKTGVFSWGAGDSYARVAGELDELDPVESQSSEEFSFKRSFHVLGARHRWEAPVSGTTSNAIVINQRSGVLSGGGKEEHLQAYLSTRTWMRTRLHKHASLHFGIDGRGEWSTISVVPSVMDTQHIASEAPLLAMGAPIASTIPRLRMGVFTQTPFEWDLFQIVPGVRLQTDTAGAPISADPRLSLKYSPWGHTQFVLGGGRYSQSSPTSLLPTGLGRTSKSWQSNFGTRHTIAQRLEITTDYWLKAMTDPPAQPNAGEWLLPDSGFGHGVESMMSYRIREQIFVRAWGGVSWSNIVSDGASSPSLYDQRWNVGFVSSWDPWRTLNLGVRYRFGSGLPFTAVDGSIYDATTDQWHPAYDDAMSSRFPHYHKIDFHFAYTFVFNRWSLFAALELGVVPRESSQLYPVWNFDYSTQAWVSGPTILPLFSLQARF